MKRNIKETAAVGSVSATSIAVKTDNSGKPEKSSLLSFLLDFNKRIKNKCDYKPVVMESTNFRITLNEKFDLQDVLSRLKGIERTKPQPKDVTTYGVEDDDGNIMKISVRSDQASEFEDALAFELAELKDALPKDDKEASSISMAELLYILKDKFDIVDVEFPTIPSDVVYNAKDASTSVGTKQEIDINDVDTSNETNPETSDLEELSPEEGEGNQEGEEGEEIEGSDEFSDLNFSDDESVEDFEEDLGGSDESSMLKQVISMLKSQAEAEKARAEAEAEKARAAQAEYSAKAASFELGRQEELMRMEAEVEKQKQKEKEAKKMADLARYRVNKAGDLTETVLVEFDEFDNEAYLRRQIPIITAKYRVESGDSPETVKFKNEQKILAMRDLQTRIRSARSRAKYNKTRQDQEKDSMDVFSGQQQGGQSNAAR